MVMQADSPSQASQVHYQTLVERHWQELYRFAYRLCGDRHTAEDIVQETYCQAWKHLASLRSDETARAWLFQILRRHYLRQGRKSRNRVTQDIASHDPPSPANQSQSAEQQDSIQAALTMLEDKFKEPLLMVAVGGLTCDQAAKELGVPLGTVLSRIYRARQLIKAHFDQFGAAIDMHNLESKPAGIKKGDAKI